MRTRAKANPLENGLPKNKQSAMKFNDEIKNEQNNWYNLG
jgi:hypothetical protein